MKNNPLKFGLYGGFGVFIGMNLSSFMYHNQLRWEGMFSGLIGAIIFLALSFVVKRLKKNGVFLFWRYRGGKEIEPLSEVEVQKLLGQTTNIDKGRKATDEDIKVVKSLLEKEKRLNPEGSIEYEKMSAQLDGGFEVWIKEYDERITVTCEPLEKGVEGSYRVFSVLR